MSNTKSKNSERSEREDDDVLEVFSHNNLRVRIRRDNMNPPDPRKENEGNLSRLYCWHRRMNLGDEHRDLRRV